MTDAPTQTIRPDTDPDTSYDAGRRAAVRAVRRGRIAAADLVSAHYGDDEAFGETGPEYLLVPRPSFCCLLQPCQGRCAEWSTGYAHQLHVVAGNPTVKRIVALDEIGGADPVDPLI